MVRTSSDRPTADSGRRATLRWLGGLVAVAGLALAGYGVAVAVDDAPTTEAPTAATPIQTHAARPGTHRRTQPAVTSPSGWIPRRLLVPTLGIDSAVLPIAADDGVLVPPSDPQELGWWSDGARVGAAHGSVLVTGHTVHTGGGAMDHLAELAAGDTVLVRSGRHEVSFRVQSVAYYPKQTLAEHAAETFDQSGPNRLVLITCDRWNGSSYDGNTVAVAVPVAESTLELGS